MSEDNDDEINDDERINDDAAEPGPPAIPRRVIVHFNNRFSSYYDGVQNEFPDEMRNMFSDSFNGLNIERLIKGVESDTIDELTRQATEMDPTYEPVDFLTYYAISLVEQDDPQAMGNRLVEFFSGRGWINDFGYMISEVYIEPPPAPQPCNVPRFHVAAPFSVDIAYAHSLEPAVRGAGVRIVDIERAWETEQFQELAGVGQWSSFAPENRYPHGYKFSDDVAHSTSVLGLLAADCRGGPNSLIGMIPEAEIIVTSTWLEENGRWVEHQTDAIMTVASNMKCGDVLLLEMQCYDRGRRKSPVELNSSAWEAIRLTTARGIIVIEPAGNGGFSLRDLVDPLPEHYHYAFHLTYRNLLTADSGAILVGACERRNDRVHEVRSNTNYGDKVDLHAWGSALDTLNANIWQGGQGFSETSGAAAVVAGVAVLAQSAVIDSDRSPLTSTEMRDLLKSGDLSEGIGYMPNLQHFIDKVLPSLRQ